LENNKTNHSPEQRKMTTRHKQQQGNQKNSFTLKNACLRTSAAFGLLQGSHEHRDYKMNMETDKIKRSKDFGMPSRTKVLEDLRI
jgi:flagellar biosynthesis/type III secretory pathway chaperone